MGVDHGDIIEKKNSNTLLKATVETHTRPSIVIRVQIYATQEVLATERQEKERAESTRSSFSVFQDVPSSFDESHKLLKDITVMLCQ